VTEGDEQAPVEKTPVEQAVEQAFDLFVYAPIGLLFEGASLLPELVAKGKQQVGTARVMGKFALEEAQRRATRAAGKLQDQTAGVLDFLGDSVTPLPSEDRPAPAPEDAAAPKPPSARSTAPKVAASGKAGAGHAISAASLAIPDYDGLSASQVVNRLAGLAPAELANVQLYEAAHRGRKTILSKVAQLQGR
jgi:hypothetical protein